MKNPNGSQSSLDITDGIGALQSGEIKYTDYPKAAVQGGFYINPQVSGSMVVQLSEQEDSETFTITSTTIDAYLGTWIPMKIKRVISVDTAQFQIGW